MFALVLFITGPLELCFLCSLSMFRTSDGIVSSDYNSQDYCCNYFEGKIFNVARDTFFHPVRQLLLFLDSLTVL